MLGILILRTPSNKGSDKASGISTSCPGIAVTGQGSPATREKERTEPSCGESEVIGVVAGFVPFPGFGVWGVIKNRAGSQGWDPVFGKAGRRRTQ